MKAAHITLLKKHLMTFLRRRTPPKTFGSDAQLQVDQVAAYLKIIGGYAPVGDDFGDWWTHFIQDLGVRNVTFAWPSEAEVLASAQEASKKRKPSTSDWKPDPLAQAVRCIEADAPLAEHWLWGKGALKLIGRVGMVRVQARRNRFAEHLAGFYGVDVARNMIVALEKKHQQAVDGAASPGEARARQMPKIKIKSVSELLGPGPEFVPYFADDDDLAGAL